MFHGVNMILIVNKMYFRNSFNQLIFVIVKCSVLCSVRAEFLNIADNDRVILSGFLDIPKYFQLDVK